MGEDQPPQSSADDLQHLRFHGAPSPAIRVNRARCSPSASAAAPEASKSEPVEQLDSFILWLLARVGIDASQYRVQPLQRRLPACLRTLRVNSPREAQAFLEHHPDRIPRALDVLLLGVTEFFRDPPVFAALRHLLPGLHTPDRPLRVWSAACSEGNELYSVAILLVEASLLSQSELLGTDVRPEAIRIARAGVYAPSQIASVDPLLRQRYFRASGPNFQISDPLRNAVQWQTADILQGIPEGPWDLILWRNAAIYLRREVAATLWHHLATTLRPGGILMTGKAERPEGSTLLERMTPCLYKRRPL